MRGEAKEGFVTENRQQRHITERLRNPRALRRGGLSAATAAPRNFVANGARSRGFALLVGQDGEIVEDSATAEDAKNEQMGEVGNVGPATGIRGDGKPSSCNKVEVETPVIEPVPRALPKNQDPRLVSRNKRMLGQLLGTLEKFRKEDMKILGTEAFIQRSNALQRVHGFVFEAPEVSKVCITFDFLPLSSGVAEQKAHEEHERLRQQECEQIAEQRRRDLTLSARVAVKAEEKKLELLFLRWNDHPKSLSNFIRVDSWLEHRTLACGNTILENHEEERCNEEEHEFRKFPRYWKTKSSSFPLRRAKKIPENLEVVSFSRSSPKSVVRDIHGHGGNFRLILFDKGNEI
ncbi:hypothetical protein POTOM_013118 [Populus tomentosa]|uniref:Pinin/SDK/MemA protein domain-containing protein n=1 Tax=Populus tomentosa TaxID=118781 RepID=A0A8X8D6N0_POPTO|nr:hypothetical protein POTOM_013118 [Populus tomentosa]